MIALAVLLLLAAPSDGGPPSIDVALHVSDAALQFLVQGNRFDPIPLTRDPRGRLETRKLQDKLKELKSLQPGLHAITVYRLPELPPDDLRRVTEACASEGVPDVVVLAERTAPPPVVQPAPAVKAVSEPTVFGSIDPADVRRGVSQKRADLDACIAQARKRTPRLEGNVNVKFIIGAAGAVVSAQVASSTVEDAELGGCLASVLRQCTFPRPKGGGVAIVTWPFSVTRGAR
jgi:hypothetical protein